MPTKLAKSLRSHCKLKGWTIARLARECAIPKPTLHGWTTGRNAVLLHQLQRVANTLEVPFYDLAFGEADPFQPTQREILHELFTGDVRVTIHRIEYPDQPKQLPRCGKRERKL